MLDKGRVRRAFEKLVNPETVELLLREGAERQPLKQARIEFVLAFVKGDNSARVAQHMARVADLAIAHGGVVHDLVGGLVVVAFGTHPALSVESKGRPALVDALQREFAGDVKIVHGAADGHYGLVGSEGRMSYTFLVPKFDEMLGALGRLGFGQIEEFQQ